MKQFLFVGFGYVAKNLYNLIKNNFDKFIIYSRTKVDDPKVSWYPIDVKVDFSKYKITHVLITIPPHDQEKNVLNKMLELPKVLTWVGYLSSTSVYGHHNGNWVFETSSLLANSETGKNRIISENLWKSFFAKNGTKINIFRIAGIYGPKRSIIERLLAGKVQRIVKMGHYFSRIHIEDLIRVIFLSFKHNTENEIYNISDDAPIESHVVLDYACKLLGLPIPNTINLTDSNLSMRVLEFYKDNRKISNKKIKINMNYKLLYPTYKEGLNQIRRTL